MKHEKFIRKWEKVKASGFKKYVISSAFIWTIIIFPVLRYMIWYFKEKIPFEFKDLWWEVPMFFMSGICLALISWIVKNYLYAKYTGNFTPENHHHDHD